MGEIQSTNHNIVNKSLVIAGMSAVATAAVVLGANSEPTPPAAHIVEAPVSNGNPNAYMQNTEMNEAYNEAGKTDQTHSVSEVPSIAQDPNTHIVIPSAPTAETPQFVDNGPGLSNVTAPGTNRLVN